MILNIIIGNMTQRPFKLEWNEYNWIRSVKYVFDAGINKCYDRMNHKYLWDKLNWNNDENVVIAQIYSTCYTGLAQKWRNDKDQFKCC